MQSFTERLAAAIAAKNNPTVMGLDPLLSYIPEEMKAEAGRRFAGDAYLEELIFSYNKRLIDAVADLIPAVKPQLAYYELYGIPGLNALRRTMAYAREQGLLVIADGKRNDIGSTASAYAAAYLGETELEGRARAFWEADALTVNAYLGGDGVKPFVDAAAARGKGLFILVRTSNPSAGDFQDLELADGRRLYEALADKLNEWSAGLLDGAGYAPLGAVVGATWPEQARALRARLPHAYILVPGYGAQGGDASSCAHNFKPDGGGALVNASRSLICAWKKAREGEDFAGATRREALRMRDALNAVRFKGDLEAARRGSAAPGP